MTTPAPPLTPKEIAEGKHWLAVRNERAFTEWLVKHGPRLLSAAAEVDTSRKAAEQLSIYVAKIETENGQSLARLAEVERQLASMTATVFEVAEVGDGYGPTNQQSGTTGEGHAECRRIALDALDITFEDLPESAHGMDANRRWFELRERHASRHPKEPEHE